jgi:hypothetical protein
MKLIEISSKDVAEKSIDEIKAKIKEQLEAELVDFTIKPKKFRNKKTGEIKTQIPILEIGDYEEVV